VFYWSAASKAAGKRENVQLKTKKMNKLVILRRMNMSACCCLVVLGWRSLSLFKLTNYNHLSSRETEKEASSPFEFIVFIFLVLINEENGCRAEFSCFILSSFTVSSPKGQTSSPALFKLYFCSLKGQVMLFLTGFDSFTCGVRSGVMFG